MWFFMGGTLDREYDCYPEQPTISWKAIGAPYLTHSPDHESSFPKSPYLLSDTDFNTCHRHIKQAQDETALRIKQTQLAALDPSLLPLMDEPTLMYWQQLARQAFLLALFQYNLNKSLQRKQKKEKELALLIRYELLLRQIDTLLNDKKHVEEKEERLQDEVAATASLPKWLQGPYTPCVAIRDTLSELNWYRLYWVWAGGNGGLLAAVLSLPGIKSQFDKDGKMAKKLDMPLNALGFLSWTLYYTRFLLHFLMLIKHLLPVGDNKKYSLKERLQIQLAQRKYMMMNDLVWGTVNLVTIYWLTGNVSKMAGAWGGVLTIVLMCFDVLLAYLERAEETKRFNNANGALKRKIQLKERQLSQALQALFLQDTSRIKALMAFHKRRHDDGGDDSALVELAKSVSLEHCRQLIALEKEKQALEEEKALLEFNWYYQKKTLDSTFYFNIAFVPVMGMIVGNLLPDLIHGVSVSVAALSTVTVVGGVVAVLITAIQTYYTKQQAIEKLKAELQLLVEKMSTADKQALPRLEAKQTYLENMIKHERREQVASISAQLIFAGVVFFALTCSTPVGLGIVGGALFLGVLVKMALAYNKPTEPNPLEDLKQTKRAFLLPETESKDLFIENHSSTFFKHKKLPAISTDSHAALLRVA